ncbi:MAG: transglutaminase-like domain-containing protein, partial [Candidatus Micrarchaeota archaeon]
VIVDYDTDITEDLPLPGGPLPSEGLIAADKGVAAKAKTLSDDESALYTILHIVNWVHEDITYDLDYSGRVSPATEVFRDRRGVCVEYSHLLISMLRSLGLETRYVNGYVLDDSWQPHAWAEAYLPGHGWLAMDPTLGQAGTLDNTHLAIQNAKDHSQAYDLLVSESKGAALSVTDTVLERSISEEPGGVAITIDMDVDTLALEVEVANSEPEYKFGVYTFSAPRGYLKESSSVILLKPYERLRRYHGLNNSLFREDFTYDIQVSASFNDVDEGRMFSIDRRAETPADPLPDGYCSIPIVMAAIIALIVLTSRR